MKNNRRNKIEEKQRNTIILIIAIVLLIIIFLSPYLLKSKKEAEKATPEYSTPPSSTGNNEIREDKKYYLGKIIKENNIVENSIIVKNIGKDPGYDITNILGEPNAKFLDEEVYQGKGIRFKKSFGNIVYLVFTQNYQDEIINGIKTTDSYNDIIMKLGKSNIEKNGGEAITVETENYYITFGYAQKEAILFPKIIKDQKNLIEIVKELSITRNFAKYVPMITDKYKSYSTYDYNSDFLNLSYPTLGFEILVAGGDYPGKKGINIYNNNESKNEYYNLIDKTNNNNIINIIDDNLVRKEARNIFSKKNILYDTPLNQDDKYFTVSASEVGGQSVKYTNCVVLPLEDKSIEPYNLNDSASADAIYLNDHYIYYGISNNGIYKLNPKTKERTLLTKIKGNISSIENVIKGEIVYNNGQIINY